MFKVAAYILTGSAFFVVAFLGMPLALRFALIGSRHLLELFFVQPPENLLYIASITIMFLIFELYCQCLRFMMKQIGDWASIELESPILHRQIDEEEY